MLHDAIEKLKKEEEDLQQQILAAVRHKNYELAATLDNRQQGIELARVLLERMRDEG